MNFMPEASLDQPSRSIRRVPTQARSLERVERVLDAAARIVAEKGVDALTTRTVADAAAMPVATLYQYFADKDAVLLALVERDIQEMDEQVRTDLGALELFTVRSLVETTLRAYVEVFHRRPDFVEIWLRGRGNAAVREFGREHNRRTAAELQELAEGLGLMERGVSRSFMELAVEVGDRVFQLAFEHDLLGDQALIDEGTAMLVAYLERYATPAGLSGVSA